MRRVVFRVDGNSRIGLGHIVRCIALSEMLNSEFSIVFVVTNPTEFIGNLVRQHGTLIVLKDNSLQEEYESLNTLLTDCSICVLDGYKFKEEYQKFIRSRSVKLVVIDDLLDQHFFAEMVINHGISRAKANYSTEPYTKLLLGFNYLLARPAFIKAAKSTRIVQEVKTVFICMGGADPNFISKKVLSACLKTSFIKDIVVVVGSSFLHNSELNSYVEAYHGDVKISILVNIDSNEMVDTISAADICITPASSISLEVCCVKSGLLTGITFENQKFIHDQLVLSEAGTSLGNFNNVTESEIVQKLMTMKSASVVNGIIVNQGKIIDGESPKRLLTEFKDLVDA